VGEFVVEQHLPPLAFRSSLIVLLAVQFILILADALSQTAIHQNRELLAKLFAPLAIFGPGLQDLFEAALRQFACPEWLHTYLSVFSEYGSRAAFLARRATLR
jgi:hypothetical protein